MGFHDSGWKSLMLKQSRRLGTNLPDGVIIMTDGGLRGYSLGNINFPWYIPLAYGELSAALPAPELPASMT